MRNGEGKAVIVTGGGSGIGLATAALLARSGAEVFASHLPGEEAARNALARLEGEGLKVRAIEADVRDADSVARLIETASGPSGRLDGLVNNAGIAGVAQPLPPAALDLVTDELWDRIMAVNLKGAFKVAVAAAPQLRIARGAIVNVASVAGLGRRGSSIPYSVSKAGLISLTGCLARALAPEVRVNAVAPGFIETPMTAGRTPEHRHKVASQCLLGRPGRAEEVAEAIAFLLLGASYVNGETLVVDGGIAT